MKPMAVYHTQIRHGLTVKVTTPNDHRPDADHVVEYMDGARRCWVRDDAGWSNTTGSDRRRAEDAGDLAG